MLLDTITKWRRQEKKSTYLKNSSCFTAWKAYVPSRHWGDTVTTVVYLLNCVPSKVLDFKTPLQVLTTHVSLPTMLMLPPRIFGCVAFVHLHKNQHIKLDPCAIRCLFLGYGLHKKGNQCHDPLANCTYITMDVTFLESKIFYPSLVPNSPLQGGTQVEELNWMMASRGEMASRLETENGEIESQMDNAYSVGVELRNEGNETPKNGEAENEELVNDEPKTMKPPHFQVPEDSPPRNISEVSTPTTSLQTNVLETPVGYALPFRHNRGKPPNRYSPDEEERRSKYPITNYVST